MIDRRGRLDGLSLSKFRDLGSIVFDAELSQLPTVGELPVLENIAAQQAGKFPFENWTGNKAMNSEGFTVAALEGSDGFPISTLMIGPVRISSSVVMVTIKTEVSPRVCSDQYKK